MKKYGLLFALVCLVSIGFASTMIDDFQGYANTTELRAVWVDTGGWTAADLQTSGGADATTGSMKLTDSGWSNGVLAANIITPGSARGYKVRFKYMNGQTNDPWTALTLLVVQNNQIKMKAELGGTVVSTWTLADTNAASLTTDPVSILIQNGTSLPGRTNVCAFDEIELMEDDGVLAISLRPTDKWYLSRTETIQALPELGVLPYQKIEFDVNDDGSVEFTDTAEPWEFSWDTTSDIAIGTSGTIALKATITDNASNVASVVMNYFIDNRERGRESLILNGDFSNWTLGEPDNWNLFQIPTVSYSYQPGVSYEPAAAPSLHINYAAQPDPNRYLFRSVSWSGYYEDVMVKMWGRHAYCRAYIQSSADGGTTWLNTFAGVTAGNPFWVYVEGTPYTHATPSDELALGTHAYGTGDFFWDDIVVTGIDLRPSNVNDWNLY